MIMNTKIGSLTIGYIGSNLICEFRKRTVEKEPSKILLRQLQRYFDGIHTKPFDAPIPDGPPFMQKCWVACRNIPYGETITYGELAAAAGSPRATRAAGQAMRHNPVSIITPCHRVIASTGKLHGFSGKTDLKSKELRTKQFLLALEQTTLKSL